MKKNGQPAGRQGFTLIEILVAATIIAVLSVVGVASYTSINKRSRDARRKSDLEQIRSALEMYRIDVGHYPYDCDWVSDSGWGGSLVNLLEPNYMTTVPKDPKIVGNAAAVPGGAGYFAYMYASDNCGVSGHGYALWVQLESPSTADTVSLTKGSVTVYNSGYGMNYKVSNP